MRNRTVDDMRGYGDLPELVVNGDAARERRADILASWFVRVTDHGAFIVSGSVNR